MFTLTSIAGVFLTALQVLSLSPSETATVRGIVVDGVTGRSLPRAAVQVTDRRVDDLNGLHPAQLSAAALTDNGGRFEIADLPAGPHYVTISRNGYVRTEFGGAASGRPGSPLTLAPGETRELSFALEPAARLAGNVADEQGRPVVGAEVAVVRIGYDADGREYVEAVARTETNDLGDYRLFWLDPGAYLVAVRSEEAVSSAAGLRNAGGTFRSWNVPPARNYLSHYYPGTPSRAAAEPLRLAPGDTMTGVNVRLGPAQAWNLRGRVDVRIGADVRTTVNLLAGSLRPQVDVIGAFVISGQSDSPVAYSAPVGPDGRFQILDVAPGSYRLVAEASVPESRGPDGRPYAIRTSMNIEVRNHVDGIDVVLGPADAVHGRVYTEDSLATDTATPREPPGIRLRNVEGDVVGPLRGVTVSDTGEFVFAHVPRGIYNVELVEPGDRYLKRVRVDDVEADPDRVEIAGPARLDLLVSPNVARIEGEVVGGDGGRVPGASIVLTPVGSDRRTRFRQVMADARGRFELGGLAPGTYRIVAGLDFAENAYFDPGFAARTEDRTEALTVGEGDEADVSLRAAPRGAGR